MAGQNGLPPEQPAPAAAQAPQAVGGQGPASHRLLSYVSEPPSALIAMSTIAQEDLGVSEEDLLNFAAARLGPPTRATLQRQSTMGLSTRPADEATEQVPLRTNLVWFKAKDNTKFKEGVMESEAAGDLVVSQAAKCAVLGGAPPRRAQSPPHRVKTSPEKKPLLPKIAVHTTAPPSRMHSPQKKQSNGGAEPKPENDLTEEEADPMENDMDWSTKHAKPKFYKRKWFWQYLIPCVVAACFCISGICYLAFAPNDVLGAVQIWRLLFFIGGLPIIWYIGDFVTFLVVRGVERSLFTWRNALYFAYAVRRPLANVIRAALGLAWWAGVMTAGNNSQSSAVQKAYQIILELWACVTLFMSVNLCKTLVAKLLSSKFVRESHLQKMQSSIKKEHLIHMLLQPRQSYISAAKEYEVDGPDTWDSEDERPEAPPAKPGLGTLLRRSMGMVPAAEESKTDPPSKKGLKFGRMMPKLWRRSQKPVEPSIPEHDEENPVKPDAPPSGKSTPRSSNGLAANLGALWPSGLATRRGAEHGPGTPSSHTGSEPSTPRMAGQHRAGKPGAVPGGGQGTAHRPPSAPPSPRGTEAEGGAGGAIRRTPTLLLRPSDSSSLSRRSRATRRSSGPVHPTTGCAAAQPPSPAHTAALGGGRASVAAPANPGDVFVADLAEESGPVLRKSAQRTSTTQARAAVNSAQAVKQRNVPDGGRGRGPEAGSSATSFRHQQAMRLAQMEKYIRKNALQVTFRDELNQAERREVVSTELEAKKLAFYLFWNVKADYARPNITREDLADLLPARDVDAAVDLLDADGDGVITSQDVCAAIMTVFRERENLAASLTDTKGVVATLETMVGAVLHIFMFFIYLVIFGVDVMNFYVTFSSIILAFSFIFNQSLRTIYENAVFLFVIHPYDIGDTLLIDNAQLRVDAINITYTTVTNSANAQLWYPNDQLRGSPFINLTNSGNRYASLKVSLDFDTPLSVVDEARAAAHTVFVAHPKEFAGEPGAQVLTDDGPLRYALEVNWTLSHPGVDLGRCARMRTAIAAAVFTRLAQLGVRCSVPPLRAPGLDPYDPQGIGELHKHLRQDGADMHPGNNGLAPSTYVPSAVGASNVEAVANQRTQAGLEAGAAAASAAAPAAAGHQILF